MKQWYQKRNIHQKTGIWTIIISTTLLLLLIPLFFFNLMDIPLGILLGGYFASLFYFLIGANQKEKYTRKAVKIDIFIIILRFVLFAIALVGLALLYYLANIKIFNIFGFAGAYLLSLFIYLFLSRKEGKE